MAEVRIAFIVDGTGAVTGMKLISTGAQDVAKSAKTAGAALKDELGGKVDQLAGRLGPLGNIMKAVGPAGLAAAAGVTALAGGIAVLKGLADAAGEWADNVGDIALASGMTTTQVQQLQGVVAGLGDDFDKVTGGILAMQRQLIEAPDKFERIGLSVKELRQMDPAQLLGTVGKTIAGISEDALRNSIAMGIFNKRWEEMAPLILGGVDAMSKQTTVSGEALARLDAYNSAVSSLDHEWEMLKRTFAGALVTPETISSIKEITLVVGSLSKLIRENGESLAWFAKTYLRGTAAIMTLGGSELAMAGKGAYDSFKAAGGGRDYSNWGAKHGSVNAAGSTVVGASEKEEAEYAKGVQAFQKEQQAALKANDAYRKGLAESRAEHEKFNPTIESTSEDMGLYAYKVELAGGATKLGDDTLRGAINTLEDYTAAGGENAYAMETLAGLQKERIKRGIEEGTIIDLGNGKTIKKTELMEEERRKTEELREEHERWLSQMRMEIEEQHQLADAFLDLGDSMGGVLGGISSAVGGFVNVLAGLKQHQISSMSTTAKWAAGLSAAASIVSGPGGAKGALSGAATGAATGAMIGGPVGALIGGIGGGILGLFGKKKKKEEKPLDQQLNDAVAAAEKLGAVGSQGVGKLLDKMKGTAEAARYLGAQLAGAAEGVNKIFSGLSNPGAAGAQLLGTTMKALEAQVGIVDAAKQLRESYDKLVASGQAVPPGLSRKFALADNQQYAGASTAAAGLRQSVQGLGNAGVASQADVDAMGGIAKQAFDQAIAGGATSEEAFQMIGGGLKDLISLSQNGNFKLDASVQQLVEEARANGISLLLTPQEQMVDLLQQQVDIMRGGGANAHGMPAGASYTGGGTATTGAPAGTFQYHAAGGMDAIIGRGPYSGGATGILAHPGEHVRITPSGMAAAAGAVSINMSGISITVMAQTNASPEEIGEQAAIALERKLSPRLLTAVKAVTARAAG